jgi:hypothetical protein
MLLYYFRRPILSPIGAWTPTRNLEFAQQLMMIIRDTDPSYNKFLQQFNMSLEGGTLEPLPAVPSDEGIQRLEYAQEFRPKAPHLVTTGDRGAGCRVQRWSPFGRL